MKKVFVTLFVAALALAAGCVQTRSEYTINPDGSGKVVQDITFTSSGLSMLQGMEMGVDAAGGQADGLDPMEMMGGASQDPAEQLKSEVQQILESSEGIDAWKDVSFDITPAGKMHFRGTAYFKDIQAVQFYTGGLQDDSSLEFTSNADGTVTLTMHTSAGPEGSQTAPQPAQLSQAEIDQKVQAAKVQYTQARVMLQMALGELSSQTIFNMPGPVTTSTIFQKTSENTVQLTVRGADILAAVDAKMQDDAFLQEMVEKGINPLEQGPGSDELSTNEVFFGQRELIQATSAAQGPLFDYQAEVAAAQAGYDQMIADLGLDQVSAPAPVSLDNFSLDAAEEPVVTNTATTTTTAAAPAAGNVEVYGVRMLRLSDSFQGVLPAGRKNGYTLSLVGQLPSAAVAVTGGSVTKATTDTVQNLVPPSAWDRKIRLARLAGNMQTVLFDVDLLTPDIDVRGLQELSGTLEYLTATGSKAVDLGNMKLEAGSRGSALGAEIASVGTDPFGRNPAVLTISVDLKPEEIESVEIRGSQAQMASKELIGDKTLVRCAVAGGSLPSSGQIVVNVYEGLQSNNFVFSLSSISLTGGPMR